MSVTSGVYYSFWGQGDAMAYTLPEPATLSLLALGGLALIRRRALRSEVHKLKEGSSLGLVAAAHLPESCCARPDR